jgi:OPA family sugar phosphate sensor protein UhpC-like MFS transporter
MAVDIVSHRAAGAAMGIVGLFAYAGGALQDLVTGYLLGADHNDFGRVAWFWVGASVLSFVLAASIWRVRARD